jgi:hypothetical protein
MPTRQIVLRPGITHPDLWNPERPSDAEWGRIRQIVLERDEWTCVFCGHSAKKWMNIHHLRDSGSSKPKDLATACVACHAVLNMGLSLMHGVIEIYRSDISQVEIVRLTRKRVRAGESLDEIKAQLPLSPGPYPPDSVDYANNLIRTMGSRPRAYLPKPLCAVFVNLKRWQIED